MPLSPLGSNLIPSDFISGKLNGRDIFLIIRGNNLQRPLVIYWADILAALPSGVTFQTDGVDNTVQNLLNLIAGTNITLTPDGSGGVTIDATGGGGAFIPLAGTTVGNPVTGNIEIDTAGIQLFSDDGAGNVGQFFIDEITIETIINAPTINTNYQVSSSGTQLLITDISNNLLTSFVIDTSNINYQINNLGGGYSVGFTVNTLGISISGDDPLIVGVSGGADYSANITNFDYPQKIYVDKIAPSIQRVTPSTGGTVTATDLKKNHTVLIDTALLAALTVDLPLTPVDGQICNVVSIGGVTALTLTSTGGASIIGPITTLAPLSGTAFQYNASNTTWYRSTSVGGGGGGTVTSVNAGTNISVTGTATDPIVNSLSDRYRTSSVTSNTLSNGAKTFTVDLNLSYIPLQEILVVYDPANHMHGEVTSYNPATGSLVVDIKKHTGSGTYTSWTINLDGTPVDAISGVGVTNEIAYFTGAQILGSLAVSSDQFILASQIFS